MGCLGFASYFPFFFFIIVLFLHWGALVFLFFVLLVRFLLVEGASRVVSQILASPWCTFAFGHLLGD